MNEKCVYFSVLVRDSFTSNSISENASKTTQSTYVGTQYRKHVEFFISFQNKEISSWSASRYTTFQRPFVFVCTFVFVLMPKIF